MTLVIFMRLTDPLNSTTILFEEEDWSEEKVVERFKPGLGLSIWQFFKSKGLTPNQVQTFLPKASICLEKGRKGDQIEDWDNIVEQCLPFNSKDMQPLANHLKMPVIVYVAGRRDVVPELWFRCDSG